MDDRRFENTSRRVKRLVLDFEKNPNAYRDVDDFLDIIDFYYSEGTPFSDINPEVEKVMKIAERMYPDNTDVKVQRAHIYYVQGNVDSAMHILLNLEKLEPDHEGVMMGLADCYLYNNKFDKAMAYLKKIIRIDPENTDVYDLMIQQYLIHCNVDKAFECFQKRIAIKADDDEDFLTNIYHELTPIPQVYEAALKFFESYTEENPYSCNAWVYVAMCHYELKHDDEAIDASNYALAINPHSTLAYMTKFTVTNDINVAYEALQNVPDSDKYLINAQLGDAYFMAHNYYSAAPYYRKVIDYLDKEHSDDVVVNYLTRNKLANCYVRMKDPASAEKLFLESIAINQFFDTSYEDLAHLYRYEFHDAERAENTLHFLAVRFPESKSAWMQYLELLLELKRYEDVIDTVSEAEQHISDDDDLYVPLAVAYYNTGRKNEACLMLHNMDIDCIYLEDLLRRYDPNVLLDDEVMQILQQKRDESRPDDLYDDNYDKYNDRY